MIFADASALIAIIADEPEAAALENRLEVAEARVCSALSLWEAMSGLCHAYAFSPLGARLHLRRFREELELDIVAISEREFEIAAEAYVRYGKGRHPAALNMGDCFAYACARANHAKLLFKGNDFSRTDIEPA